MEAFDEFEEVTLNLRLEGWGPQSLIERIQNRPLDMITPAVGFNDPTSSGDRIGIRARRGAYGGEIPTPERLVERTP